MRSFSTLRKVALNVTGKIIKSYRRYQDNKQKIDEKMKKYDSIGYLVDYYLALFEFYFHCSYLAIENCLIFNFR